jgi:hypothetical protein
MTPWDNLQTIDMEVANFGHCWYCCDDPMLEAQHREDDEGQEYGLMPAEEHRYHLTLSFDCDHEGHARMIAEYILKEMRKKIPQQIDATFEVR